MPRIRILLADDHTVVRQGLRKVLEERPDWEVVAEAGDGREAVRLAEQHKPDVAILDVAMPLLNGIEATRQIAKRVPATRILVLSMHADEAYVTQILQAGATGYLLKDSADVDLLQAVGEVGAGKVVLQPRDRPRHARRLRAAAGRQGHHRSVRVAVLARARDLPADRRGEDQQGDRQPPQRQPEHRRDPPGAHHGKARSPQRRRDRAVRRSARGHTVRVRRCEGCEGCEGCNAGAKGARGAMGAEGCNRSSHRLFAAEGLTVRIVCIVQNSEPGQISSRRERHGRAVLRLNPAVRRWP